MIFSEPNPSEHRLRGRNCVQCLHATTPKMTREGKWVRRRAYVPVTCTLLPYLLFFISQLFMELTLLCLQESPSSLHFFLFLLIIKQHVKDSGPGISLQFIEKLNSKNLDVFFFFFFQGLFHEFLADFPCGMAGSCGMCVCR